MRHHVERGEADHHFQSRRGGADAIDDLAHEARAVFEASAKTSRTLVGAQQLMPEIAVTVFDVDEPKTGVGRQLRGRDEIVDQPAQIGVTQDPER